MKYIQYSIFFCLIVLASCEERDASGPGTMVNRPVSLPVITPSATPGNTVSVPASNIVSAPATGKLNPEHGKPGHRCDIAVGASLDGAAQNTKTASTGVPVINPALPSTPTFQTPTNTAAVPTPIVAPGVNPAHGQPGHRCDVAVGAAIPKTAATPAKAATSTSPVVPPVLQNSPVLPLAIPTVAGGLNPAHGQPGHRCDIEVGKPLNSAPKK
jgi:hypothetical protein